MKNPIRFSIVKMAVLVLLSTSMAFAQTGFTCTPLNISNPKQGFLPTSDFKLTVYPTGICPAFYIMRVPVTNTPPVIDGSIASDKAWIDPARGGFDINTNTFGQVIGSVAGVAGNVSRSLTQPINRNSNKDINKNPIDYSGPDYNGHSASFGLLWDNKYLYFAAYVKDPKVSAPNAPSSFTAPNIELFLNAQYPSVSFHQDATGAYTLSKNFPRAYSNDFDCQLQIFYKSATLNTLTPVNGGIVMTAGIQFQEGEYDAVAKKTSDGYIIEARFAWSRINQGYQDPISGQVNDTLKPKEGKLLGIDVINSISDAQGTTTIGQKAWNACCLNRNWTESINFGAAMLTGSYTGTVGPTSITVTGSAITIAGQASTLGIEIPSTEDASKEVFWYVQSSTATSGGGKPVASVDQSGTLRPLNDGTVTVCANTKVAAPAPINSTVSGCATFQVSGQIAITGATLTARDITKNWDAYTVTVTSTPANSPSVFTFSVVEANQNLVTIDENEGKVRATGLASGKVTLKATSVADPSVTATAEVNVSQVVLSAANVTLVGFPLGYDCPKANALTISGFNHLLSPKFNLGLRYKGLDDSLRFVPAELVTITSFKPSNALASKFKLTRQSSFWEMVLDFDRALITLTGIYLPDTSVRTFTLVRINSAFPTLSGANCPGVNITTPSGISSTLDGAEVALYPNPATDEVVALLDLKSAKGVSIKVLNTSGLVVLSSSSQHTAGVSRVPLNVASLPTGLYLVNVTLSDGQQAMRKLLISK